MTMVSDGISRRFPLKTVWLGYPRSPRVGQVVEITPPRPPIPEAPPPKPDPSPGMSDAEKSELSDAAPGAVKALDDLCFYLRGYTNAKTIKDVYDWYDIIEAKLDQFKDVEEVLWKYLFKYCPDAMTGLKAIYLARKRRGKMKEPLKQPTPPAVPTPSGRRFPVPTPGPRPVRPPVPTPRATPTTIPTTMGPRMPRYTDVATPSVPRYSEDLERQLESYWNKVRDFYGRGATPAPPVATPGTTTPTPRPPAPGGGTPVPGTPVATRPTCPPGQFWDGRQCRGSVGPIPGIVSAAAGAGGMTATGPGGMSTSGGVTSVMGAPPRYRPGRYHPSAFMRTPSPQASLGQTFDEILGLSPEVGDVLRLVYHGGGAWLGLHVALSNGKTPWFSAIGWMIAGGMGIAGILDVVSLVKRACGTHP